MCGIFALIPKYSGILQRHASRIGALLRLSEDRGKDASGVAIMDEKSIRILRKPWSASRLLQSSEYRSFVMSRAPFQAVLGHARMETNGSFARNYNNQPTVSSGLVTVHNGIIVNDADLWKAHPQLRRQFEVDTEIINALLRERLDAGDGICAAVTGALTKLSGSFSIASFIGEYNLALFATNTGSLYYGEDEDCFLAASEERIVRAVLAPAIQVRQLAPGQAVAFDVQGLIPHKFSFLGSTELGLPVQRKEGRTIEFVAEDVTKEPTIPPSPQVITQESARRIEQEYARNYEVISKLTRCSTCVLPETMPFIEFDSCGVCNYCRSYRPMPRLGLDKLNLILQTHKRDTKAHCVVPFSGGRDSSYGVYFLQRELGLKLITFTYDWGVITDLARRNIARVCGKLGIENILISADIHRKRLNIRKNVSAWIRKPKLGTVPLFMAGDKQFLHYVNRIKRENRVELDIWLGNRLENTEFKVGFCGIAPKADKERIDSLMLKDKLRLLAFYGTSFLENPAYINSSVIDTLFAFYSYYFAPRLNFHLLFDYIPWNEHLIEQTLFREFDWETSPDTASTWRIGDGTAAFYNYIYYTMAGFTEVDTFRSNQIREGMITREAALKLVEAENSPRIESMRWYHEIIGLKIDDSVRAINDAPKLYAR